MITSNTWLQRMADAAILDIHQLSPFCWMDLTGLCLTRGRPLP